MTDEERQSSIDAKRFLEDPITPRVLEMVVRHYRKQSDESAHDDIALREECHRMVKASREFLRQLTMLADKGTLIRVRQTRGGSSSAS